MMGSDRSAASLWIVVLSYNGLADTRKCLASVTATQRPGVTVLLVDNGSTDGTAAAVEAEFPWCRLLRVEENRGPAAGNNAGIRAALASGAEWIVLLNNDTTVHPTLVDRLRDAVRAHPDYAVIGPVIKFMDDPDVVMTDGGIFNDPGYLGFFQRKPVPVTEGDPPHITDVDVVNGCCMLIDAEMLRQVGLFDESVFIYHDELDLCLRIAEHGGKLGIIDHALVWHKGSATFKSTGKWPVRYYDARNLLYVLRKHNGARRHGRTRSQSAAMYLRYMYYWYCTEREEGHEQAADAVIKGISDGMFGRQGRYEERRRLLVAPIRFGFELLRRRPRRDSAASHASQ
jgi:GT2 family glycosyltransferase